MGLQTSNCQWMKLLHINNAQMPTFAATWDSIGLGWLNLILTPNLGPMDQVEYKAQIWGIENYHDLQDSNGNNRLRHRHHHHQSRVYKLFSGTARIHVWRNYKFSRICPLSRIFESSSPLEHPEIPSRMEFWEFLIRLLYLFKWLEFETLAKEHNIQRSQGIVITSLSLDFPISQILVRNFALVSWLGFRDFSWMSFVVERMEIPLKSKDVVLVRNFAPVSWLGFREFS